MRLVTKFRLALDMVTQNLLHFFVSGLLCAVGFSLVGVLMLVYLAGNHVYRTADSALARGVKQTGILSVDEESYLQKQDRVQEFLKRAYDSDVIESIGSFELVGITAADSMPLYEIQKKHLLYQTEDDLFDQQKEELLQMIEVDRTLLPLCRLSYAEELSMEPSPDSDTKYLILGAAYQSIPVGTTYTSSGYTYRVAGHLEKGCKFLDSSLLSLEVSYATLRCDIDLDYQILCVSEVGLQTLPGLLSVGKNHTLEEGRQVLDELSREMGIQTEVFPLDTAFENARLQTRTVQDSLFEMLVLILITTVIVISVLQVVEILHFSHTYGIMYAFGITPDEVFFVLAIRDVLYFLFSAVLGALILHAIGLLFFVNFTNQQIKDFYYEILFRNVYPTVFLLTALLFFAIVMIPWRYIKKRDPVELLQWK